MAGFQSLPGFRDFYPEDFSRRQHIFAARIGQPLRVLRQIAPVRIQRVARQAVFQPQRVAEFVYELRIHLNCGERVNE